MIRRVFVMIAVAAWATAPSLASGFDGSGSSFDLGVNVNAVAHADWNATVDLDIDAIVATDDQLRILEQQPDGTYVVVAETGGPGTIARWVTELNYKGMGAGPPWPLTAVIYELANGTTCAQGVQFEFNVIYEGSCQDVGGGGSQFGLIAAGAADMNPGPEEDLFVLGDSTVSVLFGDLAGLLPATVYTLPAAGNGIVALDHDNDGDMDLAVSLPSLNAVVILRNDGTGALTVESPHGIGVTPIAITAGDVNQDGQDDIVVAASNPDQLLFLESTGTMLRAPFMTGQSLLEPFPGLGVGSLTSADLGGTTHPELIMRIDAGYYVLVGFDGALQYEYKSYWPGYPGGNTANVVMSDIAQELGATVQPTVVQLFRAGGNSSFWTGDAILGGPGAGPNQPPDVRGLSTNGAEALPSFRAYGSTDFGCNVAGGNIMSSAFAGDPDPPDPNLGISEIVTGPGPGAAYGPQVRAWRSTGDRVAKVNFYAYGTLKFGVNVTTANLDNDLWDEIISGAGPGDVFGPHARGWNFDGVQVSAIQKINYFAYGTLENGVNVDGGTFDAETTYDEIMTTPGPGAPFGAQVRGWEYDGVQLRQIAKVNFVAYNGIFYGAQGRVGDFDGDGNGEFVVAPGPGGAAAYAAQFRGYNFDGASVSAMTGFDITPAGLSSLYGGMPGALLIDPMAGASAESLAAGSGPDPAQPSRVLGYDYDGAQLNANSVDYELFTGAAYGVKIVGDVYFR